MGTVSEVSEKGCVRDIYNEVGVRVFVFRSLVSTIIDKTRVFKFQNRNCRYKVLLV